MPPGGDGHDARQRDPVLVEVQPARGIGAVVALAADVVVAAHVARIALQLADHGARVDVVDAQEPAPLGQHAEGHAVALLARERAVPRAVQVQQHAVAPAPARQRLQRREADGEVDHDDHAADVLRELRPLVDLLHRGGRDVHVVALDLARRGHRPLDALHRVQVAVAPAHERLGVDVLVVLGEVQPAAQRLVHDAAVVLRGQAQLGLGGGAQQRAAELVQVLALHDGPVRRALEGLDVVRRDAHVLQPQRLQRLEAEDVADDRGRQVRDRPLLEQVEVVGDVGDVLARLPRHRVDPVGLGLVVLVGGQAVGPDDRPGGGGGLARDGGGGLDRVDARLGRDAERRQDVGVRGLVAGVPVAHLRVGRDAGGPTVLGGHVHEAGEDRRPSIEDPPEFRAVS